jgi:hypothetical protein
MRMQQWLTHLKSYLNTITANRYSKAFFSASIGFIGISIVASYYFDVFSSKNKKKIIHKRKLIEMVNE